MCVLKPIRIPMRISESRFPFFFFFGIQKIFWISQIYTCIGFIFGCIQQYRSRCHHHFSNSILNFGIYKPNFFFLFLLSFSNFFCLFIVVGKKINVKSRRSIFFFTMFIVHHCRRSLFKSSMATKIE